MLEDFGLNESAIDEMTISNHLCKRRKRAKNVNRS